MTAILHTKYHGRTSYPVAYLQYGLFWLTVGGREVPFNHNGKYNPIKLFIYNSFVTVIQDNKKIKLSISPVKNKILQAKRNIKKIEKHLNTTISTDSEILKILYGTKVQENVTNYW